MPAVIPYAHGVSEYKVDTVIPILEVRNQGKEKLNNDLDRIPGMQ